MELEPATEAHKQLWSRILNDPDAASDYRSIRLDNALASPPAYLYVVFFGFLLTMACFGAYRPQGPLVALVSMYALFGPGVIPHSGTERSVSGRNRCRSDYL